MARLDNHTLQSPFMLDDLLSDETATCDGPDCDTQLPAEPSIVFQTACGERRAYECSCGAVTITVARAENPTR